MLVALLWQGLVAQTHRHLDPSLAPIRISAVSNGADGPERNSPLDTPSNCSICRELAHSGPLLVPAAVAIDAPVEPAFWTPSSRLSALALHARAHLWRSRAPPLSLQA